MRLLLLLFICTSLTLCNAARRKNVRNRSSDESKSRKEEDMMELEVLHHEPCGTGKYPNPNQEHIRLPTTKIRPSKKKPGCYRLRGSVEPIRSVRDGIVNMHLEIKNKPDPKDFNAPEPCHDPGEDGCEGIGSCLYCKPCEIDFDSDEEKTRYSNSCARKLRKNRKKRMSFEFCLPSRRTYFESKGFSEDVWQKVNGANGRIMNKVGVFMTLRFFDKDIRKNILGHRMWEKISHTKLRIPDGDPLPRFERLKLPFNTYKDQQMIGCHIIVGNLYLEAD